MPSRLFALCGPSGVGKTTFLEQLSEIEPNMQIIPRVTARPKRPGESEELDYTFYDYDSFLHRAYSGDFIHIEEWGGNLYGIDRIVSDDALSGSQDSVIMSGIYGALALRRFFGERVIIVYMHSGTRKALLDPAVLDVESDELKELYRRIYAKVESGSLNPGVSAIDEYARNRLRRSLSELAFVNGAIRGGTLVYVLENLRDRMPDTLAKFNRIRSMAGPPPDL